MLPFLARRIGLTVLLALIRGGVKLYIPNVPNKTCPNAYCNKDKCWNTYVSPGGFQDEPSFMCWAGADIFVETCKSDDMFERLCLDSC